MRFAVEKTQNDVTSGYQTYVTSKIGTLGLFEEHESSKEGQKRTLITICTLILLVARLKLPKMPILTHVAL